MEKLSERLRERCDRATKEANDDTEPDSYFPAGEAQAYSDAATLAEAYEAEVEKRIAELTLERDALRDSIQQPATCDMRKPYEELNADYIVMCERARQAVRRAEVAERRIAELETEARKTNAALEDAAIRIIELQSQLAWTPVSAGLPTEPGVYEFLWLHKHPTIGCWRLIVDGWVTRDGKPPTYAIPYTHYRRIELPEAPSAKGCSCDTPTTVHDIACLMNGGDTC